MDEIEVEVAYALAKDQVIIVLQVKPGSTIEEAIVQSDILNQYQEIDLSTNKVGIFGHAEPLDRLLQSKDRIEIYRPITCDPKEVRRQRAKKNKA